MAEPNLKRLIRSKGLKVSHSIFEFDSPGIGQIIASANVDFAFLDMEHSGFGISDAKRIIASLHGAGLAVLVRPPSDAYHHIARVLDVGADGLMMPMVSSKAQAEAIVSRMKYPPQGGRGVALGIAHDGYRPGPTDKKLAAANRRTAFAALIETAEGIENVDAIASVKDVDCLWIGHFDLSTSLGIPGAFDHPTFAQAIGKVRRAANKHGKALGRLVADAADGKARYREGFEVLCYAGDIWVYQDALTAGVDALRTACSGPKRGRGK